MHAHMHRSPSKSYSLSLRSMPLQYLHLNTAKFKGAWRFCTFCLKLSRPMGTKSHTSKALPASIITKRIGLMVFHWATFRSGCVYLSFPGRFPHVSVTHTQKWCQSFAESGVMRRRFLRLYGCSWRCSSLLFHIEGL